MTTLDVKNHEKRLDNRFFYLIFLLCPTFLSLLLGEYDFFVIGAFNFFGLLPAFLTAKLSLSLKDKLKFQSKIKWVFWSSFFGTVTTFLEIMFFLVINAHKPSEVLFTLPLMGAAAAFVASSFIVLIEWKMNRLQSPLK